MKELEYYKLPQKVYYEELDNGLKIYLLPDENRKNYYVSLNTKFGSLSRTFIPIKEKEYITLPMGVAHFLEHKVFEVKDREEAFSFFLRTGTNTNAGTSYYSTRFYIWGNRELGKNLEYLLNMIYEPYYTESNIKKEIGIINEEIKMYDDDPSWILDNAIRSSLFNVSPLTDKIAGTCESISHIDKQMLYKTYNTFYQPSNMFIVISGNFDYQEIESIIKNNVSLNRMVTNYPIKEQKYIEPDKVKKEYMIVRGNVVIPKLRYIFKINKDNFTMKDSLLLNMYLNSIFSIIFGVTSDFEEKVKTNNVTTGYYIDHGYYDNFYTIEIEAESEKYDLFGEYVAKAVSNINITDEEFIRLKRVWIASEIRLSDNQEMLVDGLVDDVLRYDEAILNRIELINNLEKEKLDLVLKELDLSNHSFVIIAPKEK